MRFLAWNLEASVRSMQPGHHPRGGAADLAPEQHTVVIDFTDYSLFNAPPRSTTLETLNILQARMGRTAVWTGGGLRALSGPSGLRHQKPY